MSITKAFVKSVAFGYGIFTMILYGLIALKSGTYFTRRTEKESLELQLGKHLHTMIAHNPPSRSVGLYQRLRFTKLRRSITNSSGSPMESI